MVLSFGVLPQLVAKSSAKRADCALARADGVAKGDDIIGGVIKWCAIAQPIAESASSHLNSPA